MSIHETSLRNIAHAQIERLEGQLHAMKDALGLLLSHAISTSGDRTFDMIDAFQASVDASSLEFDNARSLRSEEHTSELQSLMRTSYAAFCVNKKHSNTVSKPIHNNQAI